MASTEGAIGYIDLSDAKANNLTFAAVKNKAGWEMTTGAVMPHSISGVVGAVMLGLGRAMSETVAFQWGEATTDIKRSALIAMGLTLFIITIVVNLIATGVVNRATRRVQGRSRGSRSSITALDR